MSVRLLIVLVLGLLAGGCTSTSHDVSKVPWLPRSDIDRIAYEIQTIPLPTSRAKALAILAPPDTQKQFPRIARDGRQGQIGQVGPYNMSIAFTDPESPLGYYEMILHFSAKERAEDVEDIEIIYWMPRGRPYPDIEAIDLGYRQFKLLLPRPNKAPEPTATSVTPRAMLPFSEMKQRIEIRIEARVVPAVAVAHL